MSPRKQSSVRHFSIFWQLILFIGATSIDSTVMAGDVCISEVTEPLVVERIEHLAEAVRVR